MSEFPRDTRQEQPAASHELAVMIMQRAARAGLEVSKIDPHADSATAEVTLKHTTLDESSLSRMFAALSRETGWDISFRVAPEVVEAEVIDADFTDAQVNSSGGVLVRREEGNASFGLIPLSLAASTMRLVSTGDSLQLASHMLNDSTLLSALASVPPYRVRGASAQETVQTDIIALQNVHPVADAARAAGNLRWAVTELSRLQQGDIPERIGMYVGSVASMLLTAMASSEGGDRAAFQKPYLELLQSIDRPVADAVRKLLDPAAPATREAFQTLFSRLLSLAQHAEKSLAAARGGENHMQVDPQCAQSFLVGGLILRQIVYSFRDPAREMLVPVISERFASELKKILAHQDPRSRGLLLVMAGCKEITLDFFQAVLTRYIGEKEENRGQATEQRRFGRAPDATMRADAVECLLGAACMLSPGEDGFYGELDSRYEYAHPLVRGRLLQAMKFGIGDDVERAERLVDRALDFLKEQTPGLKDPLRAEARDLLANFPRQVIARFSANECEAFNALPPQDRRLLMDELLLPRVGASRGVPIEKQEMLALVEGDLAKSGAKALTRAVLRDYFTNDFLDSISDASRKNLRRVLLNTVLEVDETELRAEARRILRHSGFLSISEAFEMSRQKEATDAPLAQALLLMSAELASRFETEDPEARRAIAKFTLGTVVPQFVGRAAETHDAAISMRQAVTQLESKRDALSRVSAEVRQLSPIVELIRSHPGYQRATGDGLVEMVKGEPKARKGALQELESQISAADVRGDGAAKSEAEAERARVLEQTFARVPKCPDWPEKFTTVPLRQLLEVVQRLAVKQREQEGLEAEIRALEGGEDNFIDDPHEDGKKRWAGTSGGTQGDRTEQFKARARDARAQGRILRLYLSSPALDDRAAQKAYDALSPHETTGALGRFTLSLRHPIVDSGSMKEAVELDKDDALRQVFKEDLGVDIGANEEVKELVRAAQAYDPEGVFASHVENLTANAGFEDELRLVTEAVRELAEAGAYKPRGAAAPLLNTLLTRLRKDEESGYGRQPQDSWSADANKDTVLTLVHALKNLEPAARGDLDKIFRNVAGKWLAHWEPPRDPSMLSAPVMVSALEMYLGDGSHSARRRATVAIQFGKKCLDSFNALPHSQRRSYLRALEIAGRTIPEEFREKTLSVDIETKSGTEKYKVNASDLFRTVIGRLKEAVEPEAYSGTPRTATTELRLPFGQRPDGGMGLLPMRPDSQRLLGSGEPERPAGPG